MKGFHVEQGTQKPGGHDFAKEMWSVGKDVLKDVPEDVFGDLSKILSAKKDSPAVNLVRTQDTPGGGSNEAVKDGSNPGMLGSLPFGSTEVVKGSLPFDSTKADLGSDDKQDILDPEEQKEYGFWESAKL